MEARFRYKQGPQSEAALSGKTAGIDSCGVQSKQFKIPSMTRLMSSSKHSRNALLALLIGAFALGTVGVIAQPGKSTDRTAGRLNIGMRGVTKTTSQLMAEAAFAPPKNYIRIREKFNIAGRATRLQDPNARPETGFPQLNDTNPARTPGVPAPLAPQPVGLTFDTVTGPTETSAFPPDTNGAVGPTQFIVCVNGRLRSFTKAGAADGVLNLDTDVFFAPVMTPVGGTVAANITNHPQIRYDRLSGRWFITMIDTPTTSGGAMVPNRVLVAVSNTSTITGGTVWSQYFFQQNTVGGGDTMEFLDSPSLGIDNNALYIGGNMISVSTGSFTQSTGFVVRKSSVTTGGPIVVTAFRGLAVGIGEGPYTPLGVDNYDPAANEGYFIGVSNAAFGRLVFRRVSNPGGTPTISGNVLLTVSTTAFARTVEHLGNTGGATGQLDGLDDNLFAAHIRNGRLWTAHGIAVLNTGVANGTNANRRNGIRWYELNGIRTADNGGTPVVIQSGTVFDTVSTVAAARQYWMPAAMVSGQGHAAIGYSTAGTPFPIDCAANGRLVGDALGTLGAVTIYTTNFMNPTPPAYNPPGDAGGALGRRWGDYSFTSLDPLDDMTMWTIQEYCNGTNTYGCKAAKLLAPPPATPSSATPNSVAAGQASVNVTITGTAVSGSGFYDPGTNLTPPAVAFSHIAAALPCSGITVNSVTYNSPTSITLNLNTTSAANGTYAVMATNPDGQSVTGSPILTITGGPSPGALQVTSAVSRKMHGAAGTFDIDLPLTGEPGVECRSTGGNYTIVFAFNNTLANANASIVSGTGSISGTPVLNGNTMTVNLTGVTNAQKIIVRLSGATDIFCSALATTDVSMNVLIADTNQNKTVNASDVAQTKSRIGAVLDTTNFRSDINANGTINAGDASQAKASIGTSVP